MAEEKKKNEERQENWAAGLPQSRASTFPARVSKESVGSHIKGVGVEWKRQRQSSETGKEQELPVPKARGSGKRQQGDKPVRTEELL